MIWRGLLVALLCAAALPSVALAHGGNFRIDGGPPPAGPPNDIPASPPPPPPTTPGTGPSTTPPPRTTPVLPSRFHGGGVHAWKPPSWVLWWTLNTESYLPVRGEGDVGGAVTPSERAAPATTPLPAPVVAAPRWPPGIARAAYGVLDPFLEDLIDPARSHRPELVAPALLAVGRSARDARHLARIQGWAVDRKVPMDVRESAVLALGLYRRTRPADQLPAEELARVRDFLLELFDDGGNPVRIRAFALYAIALLADQPYPPAAIEQDGRLITRALWRRLQEPYETSELPIALLTALAHQPPAGVPDGVREGLERICLGRPEFQRPWDDLERSHALATVARLGGPRADMILLRTLRNPGSQNVEQVSALIGLEARAGSMDAEERVAVAKEMRALLLRDRPAAVVGFGDLALGALLGADMRAGSLAVLDDTDVLEHLVREARKGTFQSRPFAALALGLSAYHVRASSRPIGLALERIRDTLAWGLQWSRSTDEGRGAYAIGVGLARAEAATPVLLSILKDPNRRPALRAHAALSLGQIGRLRADVLGALYGAARERVSAYVYLESVHALALLDAPGATDELLRQLRADKPSRPALTAVAGALGHIKDPRVARALVDVCRNPDMLLDTRVMAVVSLGLTFDPEARPSRVVLTTDADFPALTWSLAAVYDIL